MRLLPKNFLPQRLLRPFLFWPPKKVLICFFWKYRAPFFEVKQRWVPFLPRFSAIVPRYLKILPRFSGILPGLSTNRNFWGCACTSYTPASYTTAGTHGRRKDIFQGCHYGIFPYIFPGGAKSGETWFFPLETKKTPFFSENFKISGGLCPPFQRLRWSAIAVKNKTIVLDKVNYGRTQS